jgi:hypothetical protein
VLCLRRVWTGRAPWSLTGCRLQRLCAEASCCSCGHGCCQRTGTHGHCGWRGSTCDKCSGTPAWGVIPLFPPPLCQVLVYPWLAGHQSPDPKPSSFRFRTSRVGSLGFWHSVPCPSPAPTSHPQCPATQSSGKPQGPRSAGPRGCPV